MQLYLANPTRQHMVFLYRVPSMGPTAIHPRPLEVKAGQQVVMQEDFDQESLDAVIKQLERFGAVALSDINAIHSAHTLVYSTNRKPITAESIDRAAQRDLAVRQEIADTQTEKAGLAVIKAADAAAPGKIAETSLEVREVTDRGEVRGKGAVNAEIVVGKRHGRRRVEAK